MTKKNEVVDLKMTPELQKKLKGYLGFKIDPIFLYVPKVYRKEKDIPKSMWPVFKLRGKTGYEIAEAEDNAGFWDSSGN